MRRVRGRLGIAAVAVAAAVVTASVLVSAGAPPASAAVRLQRVLHGLVNPVYLTSPRGDTRLFVVDRCGVIKIDRAGRLLKRPFLNITPLVSCSGEEGLLSMAFDPDYAHNGLFYVDFSNRDGNTRVARYRVERLHPNIANPASKVILAKVHQPPFNNHKGGQLQFGPDGRLYISLGDGGSEDDPNNEGQSGGPLSSILRLNVHLAGARPTVYAYGLRNPWRFSFDRATGDMWIGDVGQDNWEEIDHLKAGAPAGTNFGWSYYEGDHVFRTQAINRSMLKFPAIEYPHTAASGPNNCAVMGGYVYRGTVLTQLRGFYLYADLCSGRIWKRRATGGRPVLMHISFKVSSIDAFGEGSKGGLYVITTGGSIYKLVP
jgi:glucose/arabinose dehydrogenase